MSWLGTLFGNKSRFTVAKMDPQNELRDPGPPPDVQRKLVETGQAYFKRPLTGYAGGTPFQLPTRPTPGFRPTDQRQGAFRLLTAGGFVTKSPQFNVRRKPLRSLWGR